MLKRMNFVCFFLPSFFLNLPFSHTLVRSSLSKSFKLLEKKILDEWSRECLEKRERKQTKPNEITAGLRKWLHSICTRERNWIFSKASFRIRIHRVFFTRKSRIHFIQMLRPEKGTHDNKWKFDTKYWKVDFNRR